MALLRPLVDLGLFAVTAGLFLGTVQAFVELRLRQALHAGQASRYVAHRDPWLPAAVLMGGAGAVLLLRLLG